MWPLVVKLLTLEKLKSVTEGWLFTPGQIFNPSLVETNVSTENDDDDDDDDKLI